MSKKKGQTNVYIYPDWCKGCGICVAFCPGEVLEMTPQGKARVAHEENCINCGFCELHCPDFAISVVLKNGAKPHPGLDVCPGLHSPVPHQPENPEEEQPGCARPSRKEPKAAAGEKKPAPGDS